MTKSDPHTMDEAGWRRVFDAISDIVFITSPDHTLRYVNPAVVRMTGIARHLLIGKKCYTVFHGTEFPPDFCPCRGAASGTQPVSAEIPIVLSHRNLLMTSSPILGTDQRVEAIVHTGKDVTEKNRIESELRNTVAEKTTQLKDMHHRVKNNLQIVSSLLDMTGMRTFDPVSAEILSSARSKIHAMSMVHSQFYHGECPDRIDMGAYLRNLTSYLKQVYMRGPVSVQLAVIPGPVFLSIHQAVPCALVLSEILSNALKHGSSDGGGGRIEILLDSSRANRFHVVIKDNGPGIPDTIDPESGNTLGLKLIRNLVRQQLKGKLEIRCNAGTEVDVTFAMVK
ncbi:MAG: PAS domain-containing protein [Deltaproteobacteria bacterium]|nr:PAS domain-containing protein [Deltaproteobacteria bacterium]